MNNKKTDSQKKEARIMWCIVALLLVLTLFMIIIKVFKKADKSEPNKEIPLKIKVVKLETETFYDTVMLPARITPFLTAAVAAEKPGRVVALPVEKGSRVKKGELLLRFENRGWLAFKKEAELKRREAAKDLSRWKKMKRTGAVSESEYDSVKTKMEAAEIAYNRASFDLSQCEIRAPFDGVIDDIYLEIGEYANEAQAVLKIIDLSKVKIIVNIPERDVANVRRGAEFKFIVSALKKREFKGKVSFIAQDADIAANTFEAELICGNSDGHLKGGMIAEVSVPRAPVENACILFLSAVVPQKGEHVVYKIKDGRAVRQVVHIGAFLDQRVFVSKGVQKGDLIIVEGNRNIRDGELVSMGKSERQYK